MTALSGTSQSTRQVKAPRNMPSTTNSSSTPSPSYNRLSGVAGSVAAAGAGAPSGCGTGLAVDAGCAIGTGGSGDVDAAGGAAGGAATGGPLGSPNRSSGSAAMAGSAPGDGVGGSRCSASMSGVPLSRVSMDDTGGYLTPQPPLPRGEGEQERPS